MGSESGHFYCDRCGKRYVWRQAIAGRKARCGCGTVIDVPAEAPIFDTEYGAYDAKPESEPAVATAPPPPAIGADLMLLAARQRKRLEAQQHEREEADSGQLSPSMARDWVAPTVVLALGLILLIYEAMTVGKTPAKTIEAAVPTVALGLVLKLGLMLGGMFVAVQALEVSFPGRVGLNIFKLCAVAIGPAAIKGLMHHQIAGDVLLGSLAGVFGSLVLYVVLFKVLMRTDAKDTAICVLVTWVLITGADYLAYKFDSAASGSWI